MFASPPNLEQHAKLNKQITLKLPKSKGFMGMFASTKQPTFSIPPLNAVLASQYGVAPRKESKAFRGFQSGPSIDQVQNIEHLNWIAIKSNKFDDPNKYRSEKLENYEILAPIAQECCGACWAVSSSMAFADRYGIANDEKPIMPSIISIMSCCTKQQHKNIFRIVDTPDCDVNSSYEQLETSSSSMGMCSGGIPYSAGLSIYRNGLPTDENTPYNPSLFKCDEVPSFPHMNKAIIDKYACSEELFDTTKRLRMNQDEKPVYISASEGHPSTYVEMMKKALLEGGPLVGGYMVLGDQLAIGTDALGLGVDNKNNDEPFNWDTTGKVYVPGAYDKEWSGVILSSVGGSTTVDVDDTDLDKLSTVSDKGLKPRDVLGNIFCGFHAVVIVGWGELDMKYVSNKDVKTVKGKDGRDKLPYWICRNSWGTVWPLNDYYNGGIKVMADGKEQDLEIPPGYWLHAMYPNESMGIDVPINYEGTDYGATMVMTPEKVKDLTKNPPASMEPSSSENVNGVNSGCNTTWTDSEGYSCKQYAEYNWCTSTGDLGEGWDDSWGNFSDFENDGNIATTVCCECGKDGKMRAESDTNNIGSSSNDDIVFIGLAVYYIVLLVFILIFFYSSRIG